MKKLILSLFVLLFGIINFGYCDVFVRSSLSVPANSCITVAGGTEFYFNNVQCQSYIHLSGSADHFELQNLYLYSNDIVICNDRSSACTFYTYDDLEIKDCQPQYTKGECQVQYNLIPVENVDQHYCETNDLCPEYEGDISTGGNLSGLDWSALYINNIQHPGKSIINVNIPDYIFWDYSTDEEEFNLYVGSGYNQDYIDNILKINSYRPDSGDFTNIFVSGLTLIFPYIVVTLFIIFVWKLLKRIFK